MIDQVAVFILLLIGDLTVGSCSPLRCNDVVIVPRVRWEARQSKEINIMQTPVPHLFLHHTAMSECYNFSSCSQMMKIIQNLHMDNNGWDDIGYNFLIGGDGRVYEGRGWNKVGAHTYGFNRNSIAFSLMGDFTNKVPSDVMLNTTKEMIRCAENKVRNDYTLVTYCLTTMTGVEIEDVAASSRANQNYVMTDYKLHGHRDAGCTECPGSAFYGLIKTWPHFEAGPLPGYTCRGK